MYNLPFSSYHQSIIAKILKFSLVILVYSTLKYKKIKKNKNKLVKILLLFNFSIVFLELVLLFFNYSLVIFILPPSGTVIFPKLKKIKIQLKDIIIDKRYINRLLYLGK